MIHLHNTTAFLVSRTAMAALFAALLLLGTFEKCMANEETTITVQVEAKPKPIKATGLLFSTSTTAEYQEADIRMIGDKLYAISFKVPKTAIQKDSLASAFAVDEHGKISYGSVRPATTAQESLDMAAIPTCKDVNIEKIATITNVGTLRQLIDVRTQRMEIIRAKLGRALDKGLINKMQKFEEAFGLPHSEPLTINIPPLELYERLSRIKNAVHKYKQFKE